MKPRKKYIRQELIKEIESDIQEIEDKLKKHWDALRLAYLGDFKVEISDFKDKDWSVDIELPCKSAKFCSGNYNAHLFISKKTGKNRYPKKASE